MYEIQVTRAGRNMTGDEAAELIAKGLRVTVVAVSGPHSVPSDFAADITAAGGTDGEPLARVKFAPFPSLDAAGTSTVASVAVVASEVAMKADKLMAARDGRTPDARRRRLTQRLAIDVQARSGSRAGHFYRPDEGSRVLMAGDPSPDEQILALADRQYDYLRLAGEGGWRSTRS